MKTIEPKPMGRGAAQPDVNGIMTTQGTSPLVVSKMKLSEVSSLIESCFTKAEMPQKGTLVDSTRFDSLEIEKAFFGKSWKSLSVDFLTSNKEGIFLLTPQAYRYYLAAYMLACIRDFYGSDTIADDIIFNISIDQNEAEDIKAYKYSRLRVFTSDELGVIAEFIKFMKQEYPNEFFNDEIHGALKSIHDVLAAGKNKKETKHE